MAGGYTYMEVVEQQEHFRLRQQAMGDLRRLLTSDYGNEWLESATYYQLCEARERQKERERRAQEQARQRELERQREVTYQEYARARNAQEAQREVVCTPRRASVDGGIQMPWGAKQQLCQDLTRSLTGPHRCGITTRERTSFEWGYIKALQDMGNTEEAERLIKKMRRGSIFRKEKGKQAAEVQELEMLYKREPPMAGGI